MAPATISNSTSSSRSDVANSKTSTNKSVQKYLTKCKSLYSCIYCRTHLANHDELVSRSFQGNHGRAYLFNSVINVACGPAVQRELNTGSHAVADIFCSNCETTLGWKYEKAYVETQKYKEGKYIIELAHVVRENRHLELDRSEIFFSGINNKSNYCNSNSNDTNSNSDYSSREQRNSLSPSSPKHLLLTSNDFNDDIEELMFPFYDDLCIDRSSYKTNLSSSHQSRIRRSMYLDSTPYDWKYSTTSQTQTPATATTTTTTTNSSSSNNNNTTTTSSSTLSNHRNHGCLQPMNSPSSLGSNSSGNVSPSTSSACSSTSPPLTSSDLSPSPSDLQQLPNNGAENGNGIKVVVGTSYLSDLASSCAYDDDDDDDDDDDENYHDDGHKKSGSNDTRHYRRNADKDEGESETQFNFEADQLSPPKSTDPNVETKFGCAQDRTLNCDQINRSLSGTINHCFDNTGDNREEIVDNCGHNDDDCDDLFNRSDLIHRKTHCSNINNSSETSTTTTTTTTNNSNNQELKQLELVDEQQPSTSTSTSAVQDNRSIQSGNSISLDDDEFFDCCTDHDVSNSIIVSVSNSTLKSVTGNSTD